MRVLLCIILLFYNSGCKQSATANRITPQKDKVIRLIKELPEVIMNNNYSLKAYKRPLYIEIDSQPTKNRHYYRVGVYYDRKDIEKQNNLYYFEVDAKTYTITVWDVLTDKALSLKEWRRQQISKN